MLNDCYVAGLFDGEGCIHIQKNCQMKITITQKKVGILYLLKMKYGGNVYHQERASNWQLSKKKDTKPFLEAIKPHSLIKREQIEIALQMFALYRKPGKAQCEAIPENIWIKRTNLRDAIKELK